MENQARNTYFPPLEEKLNIITHSLGFVLSIIALLFLIFEAQKSGDALQLISFVVFGSSLILAYGASTFFHSAKKPKIRHRWNIFDHSSIYVLIAGTYTPFTLITLEGKLGWTLFTIIWSMAGIGILFKLFYCGKYRLISTLFYVIMGWAVLGASNSLIKSLPSQGLLWLLSGGVAYSIGAVLYSTRKLKFNHAIFHVFVLLGSFCHFISIYYYVD